MIAALVGAVCALCMHNVPSVTITNNLRVYPLFVKPKHKVDWFDIATDQIKSFESFKAEPYRCPAGVLTVGYGHTGKHASRAMSKAQAERILSKELEQTKAYVLRHVKVKLTEYQLAALVSFTHNTNERCLKSLVNGPNRLNSGNYNSVVRLLPLYCKANGQTLRGLVKRRAWEARLWQGYN